MGMGEPFLNYDNVVQGVKIIRRFNILQGITISTIGLPDKISEFANMGLKIKLSLSLHSPFNEIREKLIPISKKYKIEDILKALDYYYRNIHLPITIEYIVFKGLNDRDEDIKKLARIAKRFPAVINLIPYNDISFIAPELDLIPSNEVEIKDFARKLYNEDVVAITRKSQGQDISAACGMLAYNLNN
jgi:23S rRNA (adenine2503-C2)-methyltransferase